MPAVFFSTRNMIYREKLYKLFILVFTFLCYTSYHLSRKPISVVKSVLNYTCPTNWTQLQQSHNDSSMFNNASSNLTTCGWAPFDGPNAGLLLGSLDYAFLFSYAIAMFLSGHIAERMNLRIYLSFGMICTGVFTTLFGLGYFWKIHFLSYFIVVQIITGIFQATGWPSVVAIVGNWFGKGKRGFIMGIWNSHTSVGNILGSIIAGIFVESQWGWSFIVPGIIISSLGVLVGLFMVPYPQDVGLSPPDHAKNLSVDKDGNEIKPIEETKDLSSSINNVPIQPDKVKEKAISFLDALRIPGVLEFSFCLFFAKLVSYTFLFWLPVYISKVEHKSAQIGADLSTLFDVGGIVGGITAGAISDATGARALTCALSLAFAAPAMYIFNAFGTAVSYGGDIGLLLLCGALVNGPYALITTAVSADLGTHESLRGSSRALATVTAIIDGTGSIGAAIGPLLTGIIPGWNNVFYMLIAADMVALLLLTRLVIKDIMGFRRRFGYNRIVD